MMRPQKSRGKSSGIAIVAVLISAVIFLGIVVAITGTLSISSRRTTVDQRVTLEAQYASESGLSRVLAEAQGGLLKTWTTLFVRMSPPTGITETEIQTMAKGFCNTKAVIVKPVGDGVYCTLVAGADSYLTPSDTRYSLFSKLTSDGKNDNTTDADGRDSEDYMIDKVNVLGSKTEAEFWRDSFSTSKARFESTVSTDVKYEVNFGLEPVAVKVIGGSVYRFVFKVSDTTSTGTFLNGTTIVSQRAVTKTFQDEYYIDLSPPSFAYFLSLTKKQVQVSGGKETKVYFTDDTLLDGPVHTNGNYYFKGRPWISRELTSSGCADATCAAATRKTGAYYNDGSPNPLDSSYNEQLASVDYTTNPTAKINFPGYDSTTAGYLSLTAPELVDGNFNSDRTAYAADKPPASPWKYNGRYDRNYVKFPTTDDNQETKAKENGLFISPPAIGKTYTGVLGSPVPAIELLATTTTPTGSSTDFLPVADNGENATYQLIRIKAKRNITNCPAPATGVKVAADAEIFSGGTKDFNATVTGQPNNSYIYAATAQDVEWLAPSTTSASVLSAKPVVVGTKLTYTSISGATIAGQPVVITAKGKGTAVTGSANLIINSRPKPVISLFDGDSNKCAGADATLKWTVSGEDTLELTSSDGLKIDMTGNTTTTVKSSTAKTIKYTLSAKNAAGDLSTQTWDVKFSDAPIISEFTANGSSGPLYLKAGGDNVKFVWNVTGSDGKVNIDPGVAVAAVSNSNVTKTITKSTKFILSANAVAGCGSSKPIQIFVDTVGVTVKPVVNKFEADPSKIYAGDSSTLNWDVSGASQIFITDGTTGKVIKTSSNGASSTSVNPKTTTTYTLTATNSKGDTIATTAVTVYPKPSGPLNSSPSSVVKGGTTDLSWDIKNATVSTIELRDPSGKAISISKVLVGNLKGVVINSNSQYSIWASNGGLALIRVDYEDITVTTPVVVTDKTLVGSFSGLNQDIGEEKVKTNYNPGWKLSHTLTGTGNTPTVTYTATVSPSGQAIDPKVDASGNVTLDVSTLPALTAPATSRTYTVEVVITAGSQVFKETRTVKVTKTGGGASMRPKARLTATCVYGGTEQTYPWPVFIEYLVSKDGTVSTREYGSTSETAWVKPTNSSGSWTEVAKNFNGVIYAKGGVAVGGIERDSTGFAAPAIAYFQAMTIASDADITIQRDIKYEKPVCTTSPSRGANKPDGSIGIVTPATCEETESKWARNVLGLYTSAGNINIDTRTGGKGTPALANVKIQAVSMASAGKIEVKDVPQVTGNFSCPAEYDPLTGAASKLGGIEIQGGLIQESFGQFGRFGDNGKNNCGYERKMTYDTRMKYSRYAPPSFPFANDAPWQIIVTSSKNPTTPIKIGDTLPLTGGFSRIK